MEHGFGTEAFGIAVLALGVVIVDIWFGIKRWRAYRARENQNSKRQNA